VAWALLALVAIPLWLVAFELTSLALRNRTLRRRPGNIRVRLRPPGGSRWHSGHGVWVHDVFAFRGSPAPWKETLVWVAGAASRPATPEERKQLHRLGDDLVVATLALQPKGALHVAARAEDAAALVAPFSRNDRRMT
jgi:hypothetical protein